MKRRLDDIGYGQRKRKSNHEMARLEFPEFRAAMVMLCLAKLFEFNEENFRTIYEFVYSSPRKTVTLLARFKKYLTYMERRDSQRIPKEELNEYFGGTHNADVIMPGIAYIFRNIRY